MSKKSYGFFPKIFSIVAFLLFGLLLVYMYITKGNIESLVKDKLPNEVSSAQQLIAQTEEIKSVQNVVKNDTTTNEPQNTKKIQKVKENVVVSTPKAKVETKKVVANSPKNPKELKKKESKSEKKAPENTNTTIIELPKVPEVPTVVTVGGSTYKPRERRTYGRMSPLNMDVPTVEKIQKRPPSKEEGVKEEVKAVASEETKKDVKSEPTIKEDKYEEKVKNDSSIGENKKGRVPTYIRGDLISVEEVTKNLKKMGCKVLSVNTLDKKKNLTSVVFTTDELQKYADKKDRGFMASLRVLVDKENSQITISNPLYFARAFMQDDFDEKVVKDLLAKIRSTFSNLKNSKENLKYTLLPKYHFMVSMPYYEDMSVVADASSSEELLKKIKSKNGGAHVVFTQVLSKDRILVGVRLGSEIESFIDKTGVKNSLLLPYPILLEKGEAKILDPKYYIAISYPMLKMSQFMKISDVPGEIEDRCEKLFK